MLNIPKCQYNVLLFSMGEKMSSPRSQEHLPSPEQVRREYERQVTAAQDARQAEAELSEDRRPPDYVAWAESMQRYTETARAPRTEATEIGSPVETDEPDPLGPASNRTKDAVIPTVPQPAAGTAAPDAAPPPDLAAPG